jgi:magnesium-protoporphyrin O-methyltransferase
MQSATYERRKGQLETYFDRTAAETWARLTSDAPVSKIRETVRAGRDRMRATLLSYLPDDMTGLTLLDAGCGTGALTIEALRRGATVTAIDISANLVNVAKERLPEDVDPSMVSFRVGDMLSAELGHFDHVVAMDSLIHYRQSDVVASIGGLAARTRGSIVFTFAPRTPLLSIMHGVGKLFPRSDRSPAIEPLGEVGLRRDLSAAPALADWSVGRSERIVSGFYTSQAQELAKHDVSGRVSD